MKVGKNAINFLGDEIYMINNGYTKSAKGGELKRGIFVGLMI